MDCKEDASGSRLTANPETESARRDTDRQAPSPESPAREAAEAAVFRPAPRVRFRWFLAQHRH